MFECFFENIFDEAVCQLRSSNIPFGMGGVGRIGSDTLPAENILGEHVRRGSTSAILARSFHGRANTFEDFLNNVDFDKEVARLRSVYRSFEEAPLIALEQNLDTIRNILNRL